MANGKKNGSKLIKSKERISAFGEVYTPSWLVSDMCDLIPDQTAWRGNVLEPACGNGNILVEVVRRKLALGLTYQQTAETIFGIDIQEDNVKECIDRLEKMLPGTRPTLERNVVAGNFLTKLTNEGKSIWFLPPDDDAQLRLEM